MARTLKIKQIQAHCPTCDQPRLFSGQDYGLFGPTELRCQCCGHLATTMDKVRDAARTTPDPYNLWR